MVRLRVGKEMLEHLYWLKNSREGHNVEINGFHYAYRSKNVLYLIMDLRVCVCAHGLKLSPKKLYKQRNDLRGC